LVKRQRRGFCTLVKLSVQVAPGSFSITAALPGTLMI
jgi:hypothetical protein